eukprot:TRINITY_DN17563_c0_g1_i1.p1 TRINITY_DN17563_c0_g1~~TRINITY_DN17563_c0_g1_i1.p1  ORF type:complete len:368 (-),score=40.91 TRINITY_DN17563_c0_g1_i1:10-1113(-)
MACCFPLSGTGLPSLRQRRSAPCAAAAVVTTAVVVALGLAREPVPAAGAEALVGGSHLRGGKVEKGRTEEEAEEHIGLVDVQMVELQIESTPRRVSKLFVPLSPQVARWLTEGDSLRFQYRVERSLTGRPRIHVQVSGFPLKVGNVTAEGIHTALELPENAVVENCQIGMGRVTADLEPLAELGTVRAIVLMCPVKVSTDGLTRALPLLLNRWHPLRWLLLPWIVLFLPFIVGSSIGPVALLGGAVLTLASIACLSFIIAILIVIIQRRCIHCTRRWRRLWRLRSLARRPSLVSAAFGESGPCCICLDESERRDSMIALLPCRHALHAECYANWVSADSYPSHNLICPVCRRRADGIGKLSSGSDVA